MCIDFYFNICDRCLGCLFAFSAVKSRLGKSLETKPIYVYLFKSELSEHVYCF
ncbi:hypothetical protein Hanom_Chr02g00126391 [Helianthus anomalus]